MKNLKFVTILIALSYIAISFSGCTLFRSVGCEAETTTVSLLTPAIANGLQCTNPNAIQADLQAAADKVNLCTSTKSSISARVSTSPASMACQFLGDSLIDLVASNAIPSSWGCDPTVATTSLKGVIGTACGNLGFRKFSRVSYHPQMVHPKTVPFKATVKAKTPAKH